MTQFLLPFLQGTRSYSTYGMENCAKGAQKNFKGGGGGGGLGSSTRWGAGGWQRLKPTRPATNPSVLTQNVPCGVSIRDPPTRQHDTLLLHLTAYSRNLTWNHGVPPVYFMQSEWSAGMGGGCSLDTAQLTRNPRQHQYLLHVCMCAGRGGGGGSEGGQEPKPPHPHALRCPLWSLRSFRPPPPRQAHAKVRLSPAGRAACAWMHGPSAPECHSTSSPVMRLDLCGHIPWNGSEHTVHIHQPTSTK